MRFAGIAVAFLAFAAMFALLFCSHLRPGVAAAATSSSYAYVPDTVSRRAQEILRQFTGPQGLTLPEPNDVEGWRPIRSYVPPNSGGLPRKPMRPFSVFRLRSSGAAWAEFPWWRCVPRAGRQSSGLWSTPTEEGTSRGARISLGGWIGQETGLRIVSVGYTLALEAKWNRLSDQVISVMQGLQHEDILLSDLAILDDSAGGGLAAGSALKMRDRGLGMPGQWCSGLRGRTSPKAATRMSRSSVRTPSLTMAYC